MKNVKLGPFGVLVESIVVELYDQLEAAGKMDDFDDAYLLDRDFVELVCAKTIGVLRTNPFLGAVLSGVALTPTKVDDAVAENVLHLVCHVAADYTCRVIYGRT